MQLFRTFVTKDKEALGITQMSEDFTPHGNLITVHRSRLLEVELKFRGSSHRLGSVRLISIRGLKNTRI